MHRPLARMVPFLLAVSILAAQDPFDTLREEGRWKQLRPRVEGWFQARPQDPYALLWMSRVKQAFGQLEAALDLARKAVALRGIDTDLQVQLGQAAHAVLDTLERGVRMWAPAREWKHAMETALAGRPDHEEACESLLSYYMGAPAIAGGSLAKARELAQAFTRLKPVTGLVFQARVAMRDKHPETAEVLLKQALAKDPAHSRALDGWITCLLVQKPQPLDAIAAACRKALAYHPRNARFHATLAAVLGEQERWAELEACLAQARKACPDNLLPYCYAAADWVDEGRNLDKAEAFLRIYLGQEAEGMAPDHAQAHALLAKVYEKQGRRSDAIRELDLALHLRPGYKSARKERDRLGKG